MVRDRIQAFVLGLATVLTVSAVFAQGGGQRAAKGAGKAGAPTARADVRVLGTVASVSGDTLTVKGAKNLNTIFKVEPTAIVTGYQEIKKADLATGQWAIAEGQIAADGSSIAPTQVTVVAEKPAAASLNPGVGREVGQLTVTGDQLRLKTAEKEIALTVNDQTQFHSRPKIAVGDIKQGDEVVVLGQDVADENVATTVAVEPNAQVAKADAADLKANEKAEKPARGNGKGAGNPAKAGGKANKANGANVGV